MPKPAEIIAARKAAKLTQQEAANIVGVHSTSWQRWEYGTSNMRQGLWELFLSKTNKARQKSGI